MAGNYEKIVARHVHIERLYRYDVARDEEFYHQAEEELRNEDKFAGTPFCVIESLCCKIIKGRDFSILVTLTGGLDNPKTVGFPSIKSAAAFVLSIFQIGHLRFWWLPTSNPASNSGGIPPAEKTEAFASSRRKEFRQSLTNQR